MNAPQWAIVIRESLDGNPPPAIPIDERVTDIQFGSQIPFGWSEASVGIADDRYGRPMLYLPSPVDAPVGGHMQILANGTVVHEGQIVGRRRVNGQVVGVASMGYGATAMRADWYRGGAAATATAHTIALDVLRTLAPMLTVGPAFSGPTTQYSGVEFVGRTPAEIIEQLSRAGADGVEWLFMVYQRVASWFPAVAPAIPDYRISWDGVSSDEDDTEIAGTASMDAVLHSGERALLTRTYPGGNSRHVHLDATDSSVTAATAFLETWLATHQEPVVSLTVTRDAEHWLERADGGLTPPWQVRAGQSIQVGDDPVRFITSTRLSGSRQAMDGYGDGEDGGCTVTIQVGPPARRTLTRIVSDAMALYGAVRTGSDLLTAASNH